MDSGKTFGRKTTPQNFLKKSRQITKIFTFHINFLSHFICLAGWWKLTAISWLPHVIVDDMTLKAIESSIFYQKRQCHWWWVLGGCRACAGFILQATVAIAICGKSGSQSADPASLLSNVLDRLVTAWDDRRARCRHLPLSMELWQAGCLPKGW